MARQGDGNGGGDASSDRRRVHHTPVIVVTNTAITDTVAQVLSGIKDQPVQSQTRPKSVSEARNALKPPRRCSIHNVPSLPSITESASQQASRRTYQVSPGSRYDPPPSEPSRPPSIGKEQENSQHITFAPVADNKVVFEIDGTRIFRTTAPSSTLYQLSHPITWDESDEMFDGLTLTAMTQLPYIPARNGPRRICDIEFLDKVFDHDDPYPQALIRSPPWGLKSPLLKFYYESRGRVMGVCDVQGSCGVNKRWNHHKPSLMLAAGIVEKSRAPEMSHLDYPKGVYQVQWLSYWGEHIIALEICDLVQGDNGRLKRRYRMSFNKNKVSAKGDLDLLVASWVTRVWMEEVFMKAIKMSCREYGNRCARKGFRYRTKRLGRKIRRMPRRICGYRPPKHYYYYNR